MKTKVMPFGLPLLGMASPHVSIPNTNGSLFFVDDTLGNDGNPGDTVERPLKTIQAAINKCTDAAGETIFVYPGTYVENLTLAKSNVAMHAAIQRGNANFVEVAPTTGIALDVRAGALSFVCSGMRFVGTSAAAVWLAADGASFDFCDFTSDTSHGLVFKGQTVEAANTGSGAQISRCLFRECGGNGIQVGGASGKSFFATNVNIYDSQFYLNAATGDIKDQAEAGGQTYFSQWCIRGNMFMTRNKAVYLGMSGGSGTSECLICGNFFANDTSATDLDATKIALPTGAVFAGNYTATGIFDGHAL